VIIRLGHNLMSPCLRRLFCLLWDTATKSNLDSVVIDYLQLISHCPPPPLTRPQDGTVILWQYESGRELQSWDIRRLSEAPIGTAEGEAEMVTHTSHTLAAV